MKCISKNNLAILLAVISIFTSTSYAIDLKKSNFKEYKVILFKFDDVKYYGVIASLDKINHIESQIEQNQLLDLTAKKNLSQYLNKKNKQNYEYVLKEFQKSSDCSDNKNTCFTYFIKEGNIEKKEISRYEKNFDDYLKEHTTTLKQGLDFIEFNNTEYVVSASLVNLQDINATERIKRMKIADSTAQKQLLDFINDPSIYSPEVSNKLIDNFSKLDFKNKDTYISIQYSPL